MKTLSLDSVVLFALVIPFIMTYRIGPSDTPYWLFAVIFLGLLSYVCIDVFSSFKEKIVFKIKHLLLWFLIFVTIGSAFYSAIVVRHQTSPIYNVHDIILQQESAIQFLVHGKNPYSTTYFGTPLEKWNYSDTEVNPALYHFVMEPFYVLFAVPFYLVFGHTIGFFDARIPLIFLFFLTLFFASKIVKENEKKLLFITLLAFNPATLGYILEGRSDFFVFAFLFAGLYFLQKSRLFISAVLIALSFAVKQSVWPILPFYAAFIIFNVKNKRKVLKTLSAFVLTFLLVVLPFFFWNSKDFIDSTILYLSGNTQNSYPISGYGFGMVLNQLGIIKNVHENFPFIVFQILLGIPLLIFLIKVLRKNMNIKTLVLVYAIFLFVFWYFSRYFNNSHIAYISLLFITSYFWPEEKIGS